MAAVAPINVRGWNDMRQDANDIIVKGLDYVMPQTAVGEGGKSIPQHIANLLVGSNMEKPEEAFANGMINNINPTAQVWPKARYDMAKSLTESVKNTYGPLSEHAKAGISEYITKLKNFDDIFQDYTSRLYQPYWLGLDHPTINTGITNVERSLGSAMQKGYMPNVIPQNANDSVVVSWARNLIQEPDMIFYNTHLHEPVHALQYDIPIFQRAVDKLNQYDNFVENASHIALNMPGIPTESFMYLANPNEVMARGVTNEIMKRKFGSNWGRDLPLESMIEETQSWSPKFDDMWYDLADKILKIEPRRGTR